MSKSLGNGIDPLEVIEEVGADTLRFMLITGNTPGNDLRFQRERLEAARNFANKIWNASRFVLMNLADYEKDAYTPEYTLADKWILTRLSQTIGDTTRFLDKYELGEAARTLYDFMWDEFCDWYIEMAKARLYKGTPEQKYTAQLVLSIVLEKTLQLLHPFMPFITEELWQNLPVEGDTIMLSKWPEVSDIASYPEEAQQMALLMEVIRAVRNIRGEMNVPLGKKSELILWADDSQQDILRQGEEYLLSLASAETVVISEKQATAPEQAGSAHVKGVDIFLPLKGLIDFEKEIARLNKEIGAIDKDLARINGKLGNEGFLAKAPADVIEKEKAKAAELTEKKAALAERLAMFC